MPELETRVLGTLSEHQMLKSGDTVIVALSGGGDSMALFHFLFLHAETLGIRLRAAHVNHGIRGVSSDADEAFVRRACAECGVPLDVRRLALGAGASEDEARRARYEFLDGLSREYGAKVATAHTASDQAETVLFSLARGTSVRGAGGIPYVRGAYIRPMLDVWPEERNRYLERERIPFCTDESNAGDAYARNRVRSQVLPALEHVHEGAARHIAEFARDAAETAAFVEEQAAELLERARRMHPAEVLDVYESSVLREAPRVVLRAALRSLIAPYADPDRECIEHCVRLLETGGMRSLSGRASFCVRQGLARVEPAQTADSAWQIPFAPGVYGLPDGREAEISCISFENYEKMGKEAQNPLCSCLDYDKIKTGTLLRPRRAGDRFSGPGRSQSAALKKVLNEQRLSHAARAGLILAAAGNEVLWASGLGAARGMLPGPGTVKVAVITIRKRGTI